MPVRCPIDEPRWHAVSERGPRTVNADATAVHTANGRTAFVVADGVGDDESAIRAADTAARAAARTAAVDGPVAGILAAQRAIADQDGDCVLVIAVPDGMRCDIAWVGDCRAYHSNGRVLQQITVDHTVAEHYRARNAEVEPRMEHVVTTSVQTVTADRIGTSSTGMAAGRLVLCSDGVHRSLSATDIRAAMDKPYGAQRVAERLVKTALRNGATDNVTALVVDHVAGDVETTEAA